jgi:hypothetical protein
MPRGRGATRPGRGSDARDGAHPVKRQKVAVVHAHATDVGLCGRKVKLTIQSAATCHNAAGRRRIFRIKARCDEPEAEHIGFGRSFGSALVLVALYGLEDDQLLSSTGALGPFFLIESMAF